MSYQPIENYGIIGNMRTTALVGMNGCDLADLLKVIRPELKIILYSGATDVPRNEMTSIDTFVSKADGITALIAEVTELTQVGGSSPTALTRDAEHLYRVHTQQR